jgi:enamine deaminase RidA (YjgF/YER057c/UK114 family)
MRAINPPGPSIPGISQAMLVDPGRLLFLSGHVPFDEGGKIPEGLGEQVEQVFRNIGLTLGESGSDFGDVARLTIYVRDYRPSMLDTIRIVRNRWIRADRPPASTLIGVASLFHPDVIVEIDAIAILSSV